MTSGDVENLEREIKLGAWPGFVMPDLAGVAPGVRLVHEPTLELDATYVDTPDLDLVRNGVSLRRRTGEGDPRWTLKLPTPESGTTMARREFDVHDAGQEVPPRLAALVTGWVRSSPLTPVTVIRSHRERLSLVDAGGHHLAEVDDDQVTVIEAGEVAARFREVEVELAAGTSDDLLQRVTDALTAAGAGAPDPTSKVARALGPRALIPPDLVPPTPGPDAVVDEVITAAFRRSVRQIVDHDHVIRLDDDIEGVHKARVGTRRLRSDLQTLSPLLEPEWADALRSELKELARELGVVRDSDVLLERLWTSVGELPADDRPVAAAIVHRLEGERNAQQGDLLAVLDSADYVGLLDALVTAALRPHLSDRAQEKAADVLPELVRPRWRRLREAVDALGADPGDDDLHLLRILAKRARYACELAAPVVGVDASGLAERLAELQDVLGDHHDTSVAEAWLRGTLPALDHDARFVAGELVAIQQHKRARLREEWRGAWAACDRKVLTRWLR